MTKKHAAALHADSCNMFKVLLRISDLANDYLKSVGYDTRLKTSDGPYTKRRRAENKAARELVALAGANSRIVERILWSLDD